MYEGNINEVRHSVSFVESSNTDGTQVRGQHYDLVLNGVEIGGGSVRVHSAAMQEHIFTHILQVTVAILTYIALGG